jgi:large subunit ribosomal protein L35
MKRKTKKAASKRFKVTSKGKVVRGHAYSSHLKRKKSKRRIRRQNEPGVVDKGFVKPIKSLLGK